MPAFESFRTVLAAAVDDPPVELVQTLLTTIQPKDAPIVAAALQASADDLATFDQKHVLTQRDHIRAACGLAIATPDEILAAV